MSFLLRSIRADGAINGSLSPGAVRAIVQRYGASIGVPELNPHDLRRSLARAARLAGAPMENIQKTLGHASIRTTEVYTQCGQEANAGDYFTL